MIVHGYPGNPRRLSPRRLVEDRHRLLAAYRRRLTGEVLAHRIGQQTEKKHDLEKGIKEILGDQGSPWGKRKVEALAGGFDNPGLTALHDRVRAMRREIVNGKRDRLPPPVSRAAALRASFEKAVAEGAVLAKPEAW